MILQLTKQSTGQEIKAYFEEVLKLSKDSEEFPVNLDDVWPLVFGRKEEAVRALKNDRLFVENIDYQVLRKNAENPDSFTQRCAKPQGGRPTNIYMLSVPALSSSSPARFAPCSRSTVRYSTKWQVVRLFIRYLYTLSLATWKLPSCRCETTQTRFISVGRDSSTSRMGATE